MSRFQGGRASLTSFLVCWNYMKLGDRTGVPKGSLLEG